jgi:hypothetical protein
LILRLLAREIRYAALALAVSARLASQSIVIIIVFQLTLEEQAAAIFQ